MGVFIHSKRNVFWGSGKNFLLLPLIGLFLHNNELLFKSRLYCLKVDFTEKGITRRKFAIESLISAFSGGQVLQMCSQTRTNTVHSNGLDTCSFNTHRFTCIWWKFLAQFPHRLTNKVLRSSFMILNIVVA